MKVLFCHDGPLRRDENKNYYGSAHNDETFKRYYNIADQLEAVIRVNNISGEEINLKYSKITVSPFEVVECPNLSGIKAMLLNKRKAKTIIKEAVERSDYIVARLPSRIGSIAIECAKKIKKPYLIELVTCPWDAYWNHSLKGKIVAPYIYYRTKENVESANHVVYVTNEFLQRRYPTSGKSVNCSNVSLKKFDNIVLDKRLKKINEMKTSNKIIIGTTAAVNVRFKGQQYIIQALGQLKKQKGITNFEYQLVGGGNQTFLQSMAKKYDVLEQVKFLGPLQHNKVYEWLDTIDLYVQPSQQEGLPRALIEAMSRGIPAFGARTAGIPELLQSNYIFTHTRKRVDDICDILISFTKEEMLLQSKINYNESKNYEEAIIEERRNKFFNEFVNSYE